MKEKNHVCPVEIAGGLDSKIRRLIQNPYKILAPYLKPGMKMLEPGPGPGYFTIPAAQIVGPEGLVIAADLQEGMLDIIRKKITGTTLEPVIRLHKCESDKIGVETEVDFVFLFYVVHELPDAGKLFNELSVVVKPGGKVFIAEPPFHVSKTDFRNNLDISAKAGFSLLGKPRLFPNITALLEKN